MYILIRPNLYNSLSVIFIAYFKTYKFHLSSGLAFHLCNATRFHKIKSSMYHKSCGRLTNRNIDLLILAKTLDFIKHCHPPCHCFSCPFLISRNHHFDLTKILIHDWKIYHCASRNWHFHNKKIQVKSKWLQLGKIILCWEEEKKYND